MRSMTHGMGKATGAKQFPWSILIFSFFFIKEKDKKQN
tara:strand:+ start:13891 stop:14004 length:114 start_codon:yes stop_codon:yes gene_type:complete